MTTLWIFIGSLVVGVILFVVSCNDMIFNRRRAKYEFLIAGMSLLISFISGVYGILELIYWIFTL